jgi:transcriptional regulator with XRE-family HTH domain
VEKRSTKRYLRDEAFILKVGAKIREVRTQKNVTQEELANEVGTSYSQVNRTELGKINISISFLNKIALALGVDPKDLLP